MKLFFSILLLMCSFTSIAQQDADLQKEIDSHIKAIENAKHDSTIVKSWIAWDNLIYAFDPELDFKLNKKIDSLCSINLQRDLSKEETHFFLKSISFAYNSLGIIKTKKGDHAQAIDYYTKALKINEQLGAKKQISKCLGNIGVIYYDQSDFEKSMEYATRSFKIRQELGDSSGMINSLHNIAGIYNSLGDTIKGLEYNKKGLEIARKIGAKRYMPGCLIGIGGFHAKNGQYKLAKELYIESLEISQEFGDKNGMSNAYLNLGNLYFQQNNFSEAARYNELALNFAKEIDFPQVIRESAKTLSETYKKTGRYRESMEMYELFIATRDSILSDKNKQETLRQEYKYNYEKRADSLIFEQRKTVELASAESKRKQDVARRENEKKNIIILFVVIGLALVLVFAIFVISRLRITRRQKLIIEEQKREVEQSHEETAQQKLLIEEAHTEITGSIVYAKRLQDAILPSKNDVQKAFPNSFIFFLPKDVVSGDFYWFEQMDHCSYLAVADCTGHGVPGALVSVVCSNALNRSVREFGISDPSKILDKTRELVIETFAKSGTDVKDGMDISLCKFESNSNTVTFAGANNPLWIVRRSELLSAEQKEAKSTVLHSDYSLIEYKGNKQPVGLYEKMTDFHQEEIDLFPDDQLYLFSDGFADQFGGDKEKKLKYKPFKQMLIELHAKPMNQRSNTLSAAFMQWKGHLEQIDDVCVIGVKINTSNH